MEIWCPIQNYPHYYISSYGRAYSDKNKKMLKATKDTNGYLRISLYKNKIKKDYSISRLVGLHFIPNEQNKQIDHIDRNPLNNNVNNLRWVSHTENQRNRNKQQNCSSKYIGVDFHKQGQKWRTRCRINNKENHIGLFDTEIEAALAYNNYCIANGLTTTNLNQF